MARSLEVLGWYSTLASCFMTQGELQASLVWTPLTSGQGTYLSGAPEGSMHAESQGPAVGPTAPRGVEAWPQGIYCQFGRQYIDMV